MTPRVPGQSYASLGLQLPPLRGNAPGIVVPRATGGQSYNFATPPPDMVNGGMGNYFTALRNSPDRTAIPYASIHLRPQILRLLNGINRKLLAAIGRYLCDNTGAPSYAVNLIANYSTPIRPQASTADSDWNTEAEDFFADWCEQADFTGRHTFDEMQRMACLALDTDGDIGFRMVMRNDIPRVRFYDTFHIGKLNGMDPKDGVVTDDTTGVLLGYHVAEGPVETITGADLRFINADQMRLLYDPDRYVNYRGFSPMRRGSNDLRDGDDIKAFEKLRSKISAALAMYIQQSGPAEENVWGNDTGTNGNMPGAVYDDGSPVNATPTPQDKKITMAELLGGDIPVLEGEIKQLQTAIAGQNTIEFLSYLGGQFVLGLDIPPAFFLDDKLTGPNVRSVIGKVQRKFDVRQRTIAKFVKFVWVRVIAWAIETGQLRDVPGWWRIAYQCPPKLSIDLGDQASNDRADVQTGQMSRQERYGNRGREWDREEAQITQEQDFIITQAKELAEKHGVPVGTILAARGFNQAPQTPVASAGPEQAKSKEGQEDEETEGEEGKKEDKKGGKR